MPATYEKIQSYTLGSAASSIDFTSIGSGYTDLRLVVVGTISNAGYDVVMRFNSDTASNYSHHTVNANGTSATVFNLASDTSAMFGYNIADASYTSGIFASIVIDILDYSNTNKYKTLRVLE